MQIPNFICVIFPEIRELGPACSLNRSYRGVCVYTQPSELGDTHIAIARQFMIFQTQILDLSFELLIPGLVLRQSGSQMGLHSLVGPFP
jgi:hypothetical protein